MAKESLTIAKIRRAVDVIGNGRILAGVEMLEEILRFDARDGYAWVEYAEGLKALHRFDEAFKAYEAALQCAPVSRKSHVLASIGLLMAEWRGPANADRYYAEAVESMVDPVAWILVLRGTNLHRLGRLVEAEASLLQAADLDSSERAEAYINLAILYRAGRRYKEAAEMAEKARQLDPKSPLPSEIILSMES